MHRFAILTVFVALAPSGCYRIYHHDTLLRHPLAAGEVEPNAIVLDRPAEER